MVSNDPYLLADTLRPVASGSLGDSGILFLVRIWRKVRTWACSGRGISELAGMDHRELRDLGISRMEIAAIRAGTYRRALADKAEKIVFCPEAGKLVAPEHSSFPAKVYRKRLARIVI